MITSKNLVHHEFIGLNVHANNKFDKSRVFNGTVIDETKNTIKIECLDNVEKLIPKKDFIFVFEIPNGDKIVVDGGILSIRPEDRIKKRFKKI